MFVICYILGNNCYVVCRGYLFICGVYNYCYCYNLDICDFYSGLVCLFSECGGIRKCVEFKCYCEYYCFGVDDC